MIGGRSLSVAAKLRVLPALAVAFAASVLPPDSARAASPKPRNANPSTVQANEPLPQRSGPQPLHAVRALGLAHDMIAQGDEQASARLPRLLSAIMRELSAFPATVWSDARNRSAAVRFTFGGGDPSLLEILVIAGHIAEPELALARGALAFAHGDRAAATEYLNKVDARSLEPSLAGIVALAKATLAADDDVAVALAHCDDARLLSPGSLVEETALRTSIELSIAAGDHKRSENAILRYFRRFGNSLYLPAVRPMVARYIATRDVLGRAKEVTWFDGATRLLPHEVLHKLLEEIAEDALRFGKLGTAAVASLRLLEFLPENDPDRSRIVAFAAAARILSTDRAEALGQIELARSGPLPAPVAELAVAVAALGAAVSAKLDTVAITTALLGEDRPVFEASRPPGSETPDSGPAGAQADHVYVRVRAALAEADRLLMEAAK